MTTQIRISKRMQDDIHRFRSLHNTWEERAYGKVLTLWDCNEIEVIHAALSRASAAMEDKIQELDRVAEDEPGPIKIGELSEDERQQLIGKLGI